MLTIQSIKGIAHYRAACLSEADNQVPSPGPKPQTAVAIAPLSGVMQSQPLRGCHRAIEEAISPVQLELIS